MLRMLSKINLCLLPLLLFISINLGDASPETSGGRKAKKQADPCRQFCDPVATCRIERPGYDEVARCSCPSGYLDVSPDRVRQPGARCQKQVNECLRREDNDCDAAAVCTDTASGYTCHCRPGYQDQSPDQAYRAGRKCVQENADCREDAYQGRICKCKAGFMDISSKTSQPAGSVCVPAPPEPKNPCKPNPCAPEARCVPQTYDGQSYECICPSGYTDTSPDPAKPGRQCEKTVDKCSSPSLNDCAPKPRAECISQAGNNFTCRCLSPYMDEGTADRPGRVCNQQIDKTPITFYVGRNQTEPIHYSAAFEPGNQTRQIFTDIFDNGIGRSINTTNYGPCYVATDIYQLQKPGAVNASWSDGLLVGFNVSTVRGCMAVDRCDLWKKLTNSIDQTGGAIGGGPLKLAPENPLLNPCLVNFCADVNFCPANSSAINMPTHCECRCLPNFTDIRNVSAEERAHANLTDHVCIATADLCGLGLPSMAAHCPGLPMPPQAQVPANLTDCGPHGTPTNETLNGVPVCACTGGWTGPRCDVAPSLLPLILLLILAVLFLILACCCLGWLCSRLRWFRRHPWKTLSESDSSLYDQNIVIPRAQLKSSGSIASGSSEFTIREEVEHHVTTDVIRTEETLSMGGEEHEEHEVMDRTASRAVYHGYGYGGSYGAGAGGASPLH